MAMKVEVVSDISKVVADAGSLADKYNEVSDELKDLAKAGTDAGKKIENAFDDGAKEAGKLGKELDRAGDDAKTLERKVDSAFDKVSADARKAGKDVGQSTKQGFEEASEGAETFKENAASNAKEVAASFDGSAESISDGIQGLVAEMLEGFGPAGLVGGVAFAAGIGLAAAAMTDSAEKATALKEKAVDMVDAITEAGGNLGDLDIADKIKEAGREVMEDFWLTPWVDESSTKFQEVAKDAKEFGVSVKDAVRASFGSLEDAQKFLDETGDDWQDLTKIIDDNTTVTDRGGRIMNDTAKAAEKKKKALSDLRGEAQSNVDTTKDAIEIYNIEKEVLGGTAQTAEEAAEATKKLADAKADAAGNAMDLITAENEYAEKLPQLTKDIASNGKTLDVNTEAGRANRDSLVDLAKTQTDLRDSAISAGEGVEQVTARVQVSRDAFIAAAIAAGATDEAAAALADTYGLIPADVATQIKANGTEETKAAVESIPGEVKTDVQVSATGAAETQAQVDGITGKEAPIAVTEQGTAATTQGRIDELKGKDVKIDVQDFNTVAQTQERINGLQGRDVRVNLVIGNEADFLFKVNQLTAPRVQIVTLSPREGAPVAP
jgi:hypothetical protein